MTPNEIVGGLIASAFCICFGSALLYQVKRETVHPFFKTWWAKYLEEEETFNKILCGLGGTIFLVGGVLLLLKSLLTLLDR